MKIQLECKAVPPGHAGNSKRRLIFASWVWAEWDLELCVHGEKLRWGCDECDEYFENPKACAIVGPEKVLPHASEKTK